MTTTRRLALLLTLVLALAALSPTAGARADVRPLDRPVASKPAAGRPIVGRVVSAVDGQPVAGQKVRLRVFTRSGVGRVIDTAVTSGTGRFALTGIRGYLFYVELLATRGYQHGYVGTAPRYFVARWQKGAAIGTGTRLRAVRAWPSTISGIAIDASGDPVAGVTVGAYRPSKTGVLAEAVTGARGRFRLTGIDFERDGYLRLDGTAQGLESGYLACDYTVVASFEDACAAPLGTIPTPITLDPAA